MFICSNCGELPISEFTKGKIKYRIRRNRNTSLCKKCQSKVHIIERNRYTYLSQKYLLPISWFRYSNLERGMIATMIISSNARSDGKLKAKELWLLYCCHVYLHGRICAYTGKEFQYFYSSDANRCLNNYMPSLDHIQPLSTIGDNTLHNITFVTYNMNLRKHNSTLQEFYSKTENDLGLPTGTIKVDIDRKLADIENTYQFYRKTRGTAKMNEIEQYVISTSPYKAIEDEINGLDLDFGY